MKIILIIGFVLLIVVSCVTTESVSSRFSPEQIEHAAMSNVSRLRPDERELTKIDMGDLVGNNDFEMEDVLDTMLFIPLETKKESLMGQIDRVVFTNDRIFVSDFEDQLLIFDIKGKYINKLKNGNGPGEIVRPYAFDFDERTQRLIVQQTWGFIFYDKNGEYIEDERHPIIDLDFVSTREGYMFFDFTYQNRHLEPNGNSALIITDKSFKIKAKGINTVPETLSRSVVHRTSFFFKLSDSYLISQMYNDTIYEVNDNYFKAKYVIDFNNKMHITSKSDINEVYNSSKFYYMGSVLETEGEYQMFWFRCNKIGQCIVYRNMKTGEMIGGTGVLGDWTAYPACLFGTRAIYKDYFVSYIHPYANMKYSSSKIPDESKRLVEGLDEEDNPVLILYKIKF
jgi:hypothetical protein